MPNSQWKDLRSTVIRARGWLVDREPVPLRSSRTASFALAALGIAHEAARAGERASPTSPLSACASVALPRSPTSAEACRPAPGRSGRAASPSTADGGGSSTWSSFRRRRSLVLPELSRLPQSAARTFLTVNAIVRTRGGRRARARRAVGAVSPGCATSDAAAARPAADRARRDPQRVARRAISSDAVAARRGRIARRGDRARSCSPARWSSAPPPPHDPAAAVRRDARAVPRLLLLLLRDAGGGLHRRQPGAAGPPRRAPAPRPSPSPARPGAAPTPPSTTTSASSCCAAPRTSREQRDRRRAGSCARCARTRSGSRPRPSPMWSRSPTSSTWRRRSYAQLAEPRSAVELAGMLHPTPAVGGEPWRAAAAAIAELEGMDRGWYAGPVGWMDADRGRRVLRRPAQRPAARPRGPPLRRGRRRRRLRPGGGAGRDRGQAAGAAAAADGVALAVEAAAGLLWHWSCCLVRPRRPGRSPPCLQGRSAGGSVRSRAQVAEDCTRGDRGTRIGGPKAARA